tara:strand:- start:209 stop:514 length:306 start_codon:yes stop_codon:yes gene_type:complete
MNIDYTYTIAEVDVAAKCMVVAYSAEGHTTMHIGAPLPFEGEVLEDVVRSYAPIQLWIQNITPVIVPLVGASGALSSAPPVEVVDEIPVSVVGDETPVTTD